MNPLFLCALWMTLAPPSATSPLPALSQSIVRVCSLASGSGCTDFDARLLDPTRGASGAGQLAFIDPETKTLVQPAAAEVEDLSRVISIEESRSKDKAVRVQTLPNGTLKLGPGSSFTVYLKATLKATVGTQGEKP
jgi:hypothetical protein